MLIMELQRNSCGRDAARIKLISSELAALRKNFKLNFAQIRDKEELITENQMVRSFNMYDCVYAVRERWPIKAFSVNT